MYLIVNLFIYYGWPLNGMYADGVVTSLDVKQERAIVITKDINVCVY